LTSHRRSASCAVKSRHPWQLEGLFCTVLGSSRLHIIGCRDAAVLNAMINCCTMMLLKIAADVA